MAQTDVGYKELLSKSTLTLEVTFTQRIGSDCLEIVALFFIFALNCAKHSAHNFVLSRSTLVD